MYCNVLIMVYMFVEWNIVVIIVCWLCYWVLIGCQVDFFVVGVGYLVEVGVV